MNTTEQPEDGPALEAIWALPGKGAAADHATCGEYATYGHAVYVGALTSTTMYEYHWWRARRACHAYDCPVNLATTGTRWANGWSLREAGIVTAGLGSRSTHVVLSPPGPDGPLPAPADVRSYRRLRAGAYRALRVIYPGVRVTAAVVFHPLRCVDADREGGHEGAHFHALLRHPGRYDGNAVARLHARTGWIVKVLGVRSTHRVAVYELHHAGRLSCPTSNSASRARYATLAVTWVGLDQEGWERVSAARKALTRCPVCDQEVDPVDLYLLRFLGDPPGVFVTWDGDLRIERVSKSHGVCYAADVDWDESRRIGGRWGADRE